MAATPTGDSWIGEWGRLFDVASRLGGFDPFYGAARAAAIARWGAGIGAMVAASAARFPSRVAVDDGEGRLTYRELDRAASNAAAFLQQLAAQAEQSTEADREPTVGILCRNHRWFLVAQLAAERAGLDLVLLSTALPAAKLAEVAQREGLIAVVADREFLDVVAGAGIGAGDEDRTTVVVADGSPADPAQPDLETIAATPGRCPMPRRRSRLVLLTSGTTGPPKGARRENRAPGTDGLGMLSVAPIRVGDSYLVCSPLFHAWGLSQSTVAMATASTLHLRRRFDVDDTFELMRNHRIDVLAVVPLMLRRMLRQEADAVGVHPPRLVFSSGNVLSGELALAWMDRFGDRLYNYYGSTETAIGTIATPADLRAAPGTVGRAPSGVTVGILDREHMPVPVGARGRVHLSSRMQFSGYTDGTDSDRTGTLMATGDLGYLDDSGLLHIEGRVNDMIVTGGENVFPSRVEEVLERNAAVDNVAVVGVDDEDFGQRVVAFVVERRGRRLDVDAMLRDAADELQSFMVPREVRVVDSLPMTTTGKVIRHRLAVLGDSDHV